MNILSIKKENSTLNAVICFLTVVFLTLLLLSPAGAQTSPDYWTVTTYFNGVYQTGYGNQVSVNNRQLSNFSEPDDGTTYNGSSGDAAYFSISSGSPPDNGNGQYSQAYCYIHGSFQITWQLVGRVSNSQYFVSYTLGGLDGGINEQGDWIDPNYTYHPGGGDVPEGQWATPVYDSSTGLTTITINTPVTVEICSTDDRYAASVVGNDLHLKDVAINTTSSNGGGGAVGGN